MSDAWAKLIRLGKEEDDVMISNDEYIIGRAEDCDLRIENNKLVSSRHCKITREDHTVYITDTSTNGTQVDGNRVNQDKVELKDGDEIHIVFRKSGKDCNVAYIFEMIRPNITQTVEVTQEYDADVNLSDEDGEPSKKKVRTSENGQPDKPDGGDGASTTLSSDDALQDNLICSICQEILHNAVSLQPCMHTFCAGCFSAWMPHSIACPSCRKNTAAVAQNHMIRSLIDGFLQRNPHKKRSAEDIEDQDKKNKITKMHMPLSNRARTAASYDSDDSDFIPDDDQSDYSDDNTGPVHTVPPQNIPICRSCDGYQTYQAGILSMFPSNIAAATPSVTPPSYTCTSSTRHITCFCCLQPLPDRRSETGLPTVMCSVCDGIFCHMYWGCQKATCRGCLSPLNSANLEDSLLNSLLMQNATESKILKDYMASKSLTLSQLLTEQCQLLDQGEITLNNDFSSAFLGKNVSGSSIVCYRCASKALTQLAYHYRSNINPTDLPNSVTSKEDCYWGKKCRTQNKPHHAAKWNHICEQTRFT